MTMTTNEMVDALNGRPEQRNAHDLLTSVCSLLEELLAEAKHSNTTAREGAVSSVEIKFLAPTKDNPEGKAQPVIKCYAGSVPPVEEAIEAYGRAVRLAQEGQMRQWAAEIAK